MVCPCNFARSGGFLLALAACVVGSPLFFGFNLLAALLRVWCGGGAMSALSQSSRHFSCCSRSANFCSARTPRGRRRPVQPVELLILIGLALAVVMYWSDATAGMTAGDAAGVHSVFVAVLADSAVNVWLQLRGFLPRRRAYDYEPSPAFMTRRQDATIARLMAERDRAIAEGGREGEAATLLKAPGVARAILSVLHPDRVNSDADKRVATERFNPPQSFSQKWACGDEWRKCLYRLSGAGRGNANGRLGGRGVDRCGYLAGRSVVARRAYGRPPDHTAATLPIFVAPRARIAARLAGLRRDGACRRRRCRAGVVLRLAGFRPMIARQVEFWSLLLCCGLFLVGAVRFGAGASRSVGARDPCAGPLPLCAACSVWWRSSIWLGSISPTASGRHSAA